MTAAERAALGAAQEALLASLVGGADAPPGFDPERLRVQAAVLRAKRHHAAEEPPPVPRPRRLLLRRRPSGGAPR
ncbi:hypothetical protein [Streptomyces sp. NPDC021020]|uniref:hypothetical protein n=1 Tax=Streptomyces sp. NPDC021020 TaxID=3365109 RepID=UPI0037994075